MRRLVLNFNLKSVIAYFFILLLSCPAVRGQAPEISRVDYVGGLPSGMLVVNPRGNDLVGHPIDPEQIQVLAHEMVSRWIAQGFPQATVKWQAVGDEKGEGLILIFTSDPGLQEIRRFHELQLSGNTLTHPHILLREVPLVKGEPFNTETLQAIQTQILTTELFSSVLLVPHPTTSPGVYDLELQVEERRTGRIESGVSYASEQGAVFLFSIQEQNFSFSPPWRGDALQPSFTANIGSELLLVEGRLRNPRLGYSLWGLVTDIYYEDNQYLSEYYSQKDWGVQLFLNHPLGRHQVVAVGGGLTQYTTYDYDDGGQDIPLFIDESEVNLHALYGIWQFEKRNRNFRPTQGVNLMNKIGWGTSLLGGDTEVIQYEGKGTLYMNPFHEHVIVLKGGVQMVDPQGDTELVPLPLREWLGGVETLRGFAYHSVSPLTDTGVPMGGLSSWWSAVEYMIPVSRFLDTSLYYELGNVSEDAWDLGGNTLVSDWGIGLLVRAENFPIRFDLAFPIRVMEGDLENQKGEALFSFSVGYTF
ncbi:BamA/TamA family outer membrane protein [Kiritimatiellota bacterium B12222]|nr:BamA/TamA family outer membrane protein [Kiritimatiellota bacterium B12222]